MIAVQERIRKGRRFGRAAIVIGNANYHFATTENRRIRVNWPSSRQA